MADETTTTPGEEDPQTTEGILRIILEEQRSHRAEVAALREEIAASKRPVPALSATLRTPEELLAARMEEISMRSHYCPGCGKLYDYPQKCIGKAESPHPPIEVVSTDELKSGDEAQHTAPEYVTA